jgi:hypothetical protein
MQKARLYKNITNSNHTTSAFSGSLKNAPLMPGVVLIEKEELTWRMM